MPFGPSLLTLAPSGQADSRRGQERVFLLRLCRLEGLLLEAVRQDRAPSEPSAGIPLSDHEPPSHHAHRGSEHAADDRSVERGIPGHFG